MRNLGMGRSLSPLVETSPAAPTLERKLNAGLQELRVTLEIEAVEGAVSVDELQPHVVRQVPVDHRREAPQLAAVDATVVEVDVGPVEDGLPGPRAALEHAAVGRDRVEIPAASVVAARLSRDQPDGDDVARVERRIVAARRIGGLPVVLASE